MSLPCVENRATGRSTAAVGAWATSLVLAACLVPATSIVLAIVDPALRDWFLIPVTLCGVLIGVDAVEWVRRRRDVFDPQAILGLFGLHFYYLAPVLHVMLDRWPPIVSPATGQWRTALGVMALLNLAGLIVYRVVVWLPERPRRLRRPRRSVLRLDEGRFYRLAVLAVLAGLLAFAAEVLVLGGPDGFLHAMTSDRDALAGLGWLLVMSESFPLLLFALVAVRFRTALRRRGGLVILLLVGLVAIQFAVGGLRGSRSSVLWPLVLGLVLVHFLIFSISRRAFAAAAVVVVAFTYGYGLYKGAGAGVVDIAKGSRTVEEVSTQTGRDLPTVLLGDLGRADMHALVLDRVLSGADQYAYGSTYLAASLSLVPGQLRPDKPRDKVEVGTDLLYGPGTYAAGLRSGRVYGLTGEAILNFGPTGGLLSFVVLGLFLRFARRWHATARRSDDPAPKLLCLPLCAVTVILLTADMDNILSFYVGEALPLAAVVVIASVGRRGRPAQCDESGRLTSRYVLASKRD
ncbi:hypothetical protein ACN27F_27245 [Solwaraspora sp. WMMB335]|uniref:hypothetical protein n=1 Tax=Solwaraspora sp. WMMB335 TaxID=3404118 RepID=UPI003B960D10